MKKRLFVGIIIGLFLIASFAIAQNETEEDVGSAVGGVDDEAYACLNARIEETPRLSLDEAIFSMLALGGKDEIVNRISNSQSVGESCWPAGGCEIKETAQVAIAYERAGRGTSSIKTWLDSRSKNTENLNWFLQIDIPNRVEAECSIKTGLGSGVITINEDQSLRGGGGDCFTIDSDGFWLRFRDNCLDENIEISCDQDFVSALAYQKKTGGKFYIFGDAHSAASLGTTTEKVESKCFMIDDSCDYEGSLWGALAYQEMGENVNRYLPYVLSFSEDNSRYFPETFLFALTGGQEFYSNVVQEQKQGKYWQIAGTPYNRFYDTSLAMIALGSTSAVELTNAKDYLAGIRTDEGCWNNNNIRDTAFVLYAGWPRGVSSAQQSCVGAGYSCEIATNCEAAGGEVLYEYECPTFGAPCCSVVVPEQSCSEQGGIVCGSGEECSANEVSSSEGSCCLGNCEAVEVENICGEFGGVCKTSCDSGEVEEIYSCGEVGGVCCVEDEGGIGLIWWIIILILLIGLVVAGIIFREKLKVWYRKFMDKAKTMFKKKGKGGPAPVQSPMGPGPRAPPRVAPGMQPSQRMTRPAPANVAPVKPRMPVKDNLDNTLKKLREMHG